MSEPTTDRNAIYARTSAALARQHFLVSVTALVGGGGAMVLMDSDSESAGLCVIQQSDHRIELLHDYCVPQESVNVRPIDFVKRVSQINLQTRFEALARTWKESTAVISSVAEIVSHPAYQQIIGFGEPAVPLILKQLQLAPKYWFWALKAISGEDPVPAKERGNIRAMAEYWLAWGRTKGYVE